MDYSVELLNVGMLLEDNRDELMVYIKDYICLRLLLLKRKNDVYLPYILKTLDDRYKTLFDELNEEFLIYDNIISYIKKYIGVSSELVLELCEYSKEINDLSDKRIEYSKDLYSWFSNIAINPVINTKYYECSKYESKIPEDALEKLSLNDASLHFEPETSQALGFGFRCGFLGLLHMDVVEERLEREYNLSLIATSPSVIYHVYKTDGIMEEIDNPSALPEPQKIDHIEEPYVKCDIMVPKEYVGPMMDLCQKKRGEYVDLQVLDDVRMMMVYQMPLSEIIYDFFDKMKSCTKGYASFDYEFSGYRTSSLVKMDILLNGQIVDALSTIVFRDFAYNRGNAMAVKLKDLIPKQQFEIPVQAAIGGKIIARTNIKALRKNVLAKCYGGDISRKKKLLEKQKEGKKRMKMVGSVEIPQEAFMAVLSMDDD